MTALAANKAVNKEIDSSFSQLIGSFGGGAIDNTKTFFVGAILAFDPADSKIKPAVTGANLIVLGRCEEYLVANDGSTSVRVRMGVFGPYANSAAADAIANDDAGKLCYAVDDQTVALTSNTNARSRAGVIYSVDSSGVYVAFNPLAL